MEKEINNPIFEGLPYKFILGPCSAESKEQLTSIAEGLMQTKENFIFRAGVWKPRTKPGGFEGLGDIALSWLDNDIQNKLGIKCAIEVANREQVYLAISNNIKILWIGARTVCDPFAVQEIADALKDFDPNDEVHVLVKNPISPDEALWEGAIMRFYKIGKHKISAIFRGFSHYNTACKYRNNPIWSIPLKLKMKYPSLQIYCDPSHISGNSDYVNEIIDKAHVVGFSDFMIEVHNCPNEAWTDASQQITPEKMQKIIEYRVKPFERFKEDKNENYQINLALASKREMIDEIDESLFNLLAERFDICKKIAEIKEDHHVTTIQPSRIEEKNQKFKRIAEQLNLNEKFVMDIWNLVHEESVDIQEKYRQSL